METITKVTSGSTPEVAEFVDELYRRVVKAGTHRAASIVAVAHDEFRTLNVRALVGGDAGVVFDLKGILDRTPASPRSESCSDRPWNSTSLR